MSNALRTGWTTGACAAAAAKAACEGLLGGAVPDEIGITLPRGERPVFRIEERAMGEGWAEAAVVKDAGDDPDVTHGALVRALVALGSVGVSFHGGEGVGRVTLPGLPIPPGEPAINPGPRRMITEALSEIADAHHAALAFSVTLSVPGGAEIAKKTWNPRLGIVDGISILGTTGIVRPFSCSAWIASIHRGIDVARSVQMAHVLGATGATSEATARAYYGLPEIACLDMGDFAGGLLKYLRRNPLPRLTIAGGIGKLTKLAQGALDLHSARSQVDFERLGALATELGADGNSVANANTALQALEIAPGLAPAVAHRALATVRSTLGAAPVSADVLVVSRAGEILARAGP